MRRHGRAFAALLLALSLTCVAAQQAVAAGELLRPIREAANYERGEEREGLVSQIREADPAEAGRMLREVIAEVENRHETDDVNFVMHCIIALGEIGDVDATEALLDAAQDQNLRIAYRAAMALGRIWEEEGLRSPEAVRVNVDLLAHFYSPLPDAFAYGPGIALSVINGLMSAEEAGRRGPEQLRSDVDDWVQANRNDLPPLLEWPWQLLFRRVLVSEDAAERQEAIEALLQQRALGPVEQILDAIRRQQLPEQELEALADLLGQVTGVPYPPPDYVNNTVEDAIEEWRERWMDRLKTRTDQKYLDYAWKELELALRRYEVQPSDADAQRVAALRSVLVQQLPGPDAIPAHASPEARTLLTDPLQSKQVIAAAVQVLQDEEATDFDRASALEDIEAEVRRRHGPVVGEQFLQPLANVAAAETNLMFATRLGNILWAISGIPLQLEDPSQQVRDRRLQDWAEALEAREGIALELTI